MAFNSRVRSNSLKLTDNNKSQSKIRNKSIKGSNKSNGAGKSILGQKSMFDPTKSIQKSICFDKSYHGGHKLPRIVQDEDNSEKYLEKLHTHISYLNKEITQIKDKQGNYKQSLMDMMNKDNKPVVQHAVDTEFKYKGMKTQIIAEINVFEDQLMHALTEIKALEKEKVHKQEALGSLEQQELDLNQTINVRTQELRDRLARQENQRGTIQDNVYKLEKEHKQKQFEFERKVDEDKHIAINMDRNMQNYNDNMGVLMSYKEQSKAERETDDKYVKLLAQRKQGRDEFLQNQKKLYDQQQVVKGLVEVKNQAKKTRQQNQLEIADLKKELDEFQKILDQEYKRTEYNVDTKYTSTKNDEVISKERELAKLKKEGQKIKDEFDRKDKEFREITEDLYKQDKFYKNLRSENAKTEMILKEIQITGTQPLKDQDGEPIPQIIYVSTKELKEQIDIQQQQLQENQELYEEQKKIYNKKVINRAKLDDDISYAEAKEEELRRIVKLEDEMRKVQVKQLRDISHQNEQINKTIQMFDVDWDNMQNQSRNYN